MGHKAYICLIPYLGITGYCRPTITIQTILRRWLGQTFSIKIKLVNKTI